MAEPPPAPRQGRLTQLARGAWTHDRRKVLLLLPIVLGILVVEVWEAVATVEEHGWNARQAQAIHVANPKDFTFAVLGDNEGTGAAFESVLKDIAADPEEAFALVAGDFVARPSTENYDLFFAFLRRHLKIPLLVTTGNRDVRGQGRRLYAEAVGPAYVDVRVGRCAFLLLDNALDGNLDEAQYRWLEERLAADQGCDARLVFMHVPLRDVDRGIRSHCLAAADTERLLGLLRQYRVTHLFAAHVHGYYTGLLGGVPFTLSGGGGGPLQGSDPAHFFFHYLKVRVRGGQVDVEVRRIEPPFAHEWFGRYGHAAWLAVEELTPLEATEAALYTAATGLVLLILLGAWRRRKA